MQQQLSVKTLIVKAVYGKELLKFSVMVVQDFQQLLFVSFSICWKFNLLKIVQVFWSQFNRKVSVKKFYFKVFYRRLIIWILAKCKIQHSH